MRSKEQWERELRYWIDCLVEDIGNKYGTQITEEERMERRISDIELRESVIEQVSHMVRCRKISERMWQEGRKEREYRLVTTISRGSLSTSTVQ